MSKAMSAETTSARRLTWAQTIEILRLAGAHAWSFPFITVLGVLSSVAESLGVSLIILFLYTVMGRKGDASAAGGSLGTFFAQLGAHVHSTGLLAFLILLAIAAKAGFTAIYGALSSHVQNDLGRDIRDRIHRQYLEVDYNYVRQREEGEMLKVLAIESWAVADAYQYISRIVINATSMLVMIGILLLISWPITLIAVGGSAILCLGLNLLTRPVRQLGRQAAEASQHLAARMLQTLQGMRAIRAFGQEAHHQKAFESASSAAKAVATRTALLFALISPASDSGYVLLLGAILAVAATLSIPSATTLACIVLLYRVQLPLRELQGAIFSLAEKEAPLLSVADALRRSDKHYLARGFRPFHSVNHAIEFRDVDFRYTPAGPDILKKVSLRIPTGRTTALIGASGAGKTTIVNLLLRLDEPAQGQILVDGVPLGEIRREDWLQRLAVAGQDIDLMDSTIEANIRIADARADTFAVRDAAASAGLLDVIDAFPDGMEHWIGPQGIHLSGGQRQRLGLARAILRDPHILILDEATSALDDGLERTVQRNLRAKFGDRTVIIIAHRLNTLLSVDHLICLEGGRVAEEGLPSDLWLKPNGTFRRLLQERTERGGHIDRSAWISQDNSAVVQLGGDLQRTTGEVERMARDT